MMQQLIGHDAAMNLTCHVLRRALSGWAFPLAAASIAASKDMREPLVPMLLPIYSEHFLDTKIQSHAPFS